MDRRSVAHRARVFAGGITAILRCARASPLTRFAGGRPSPVLCCVVVSLLLAGCSGFGGFTHQTQTETPTDTFELIQSPADGRCASWIGFWGSSDPERYDYTKRTVRIGYTLPANTTTLFVAFEGNRSLGFSMAGPYSEAVTADGSPVTFNESMTRTHIIRVVAYNDTNGNRRFDRGIDRPCYEDGERVEAGPHEFDFSQFPTAGPS